jgi:hypothetical protein
MAGEFEVSARVTKNLIPAFIKRVEADVAAAVAETLTAIEQDVKGGPHSLYQAYPPKPSYDRTGNLGRSYHMEMRGPFEGIVGSDPGIAPYAVFVEYGTSKMAPEPHLVPSAEAQRLPFLARVKAALRIAG